MELDFTNDVVEKLLFRRVLTEKNWLNIMSKIFDRRWFSSKCAEKLFEISVKYYNKYSKPINLGTLKMLADAKCGAEAGFTKTDVAQFMTQAETVAAAVPDDVAESNIREYIRKNALSWTLMDNTDILAEGDNQSSDKYQQIVDKCLANFDKIQRITFNDTDLGFNYFDKASADAHWNALKNPDARIKTGWASVDEYTNGGFLKDGRMLGLFMAQAGLGKSLFLSNFGVNCLKQGLSVVVISLEMSQDVYAQRFDAHISKKNINRLAENEQEARTRIDDFYKQYPTANLIIKEFPPRSITTKDIQIYLESLKAAGHRVDVIIVDYLNLVLPARQTDSMFKDGMAVSEELRGLSYTMKCPVISAVQSNSEGMNNENIDMQNVSESRGIVHTADALFAIYQTDALRQEGQLGFKVIKNRLGGRVGTKAKFSMDPSTLILADITNDTRDIPMSSDNDQVDGLSRMINSMPDSGLFPV